jgi:DNA-binding NarL/FixJ family response regulator
MFHSPIGGLGDAGALRVGACVSFISALHIDERIRASLGSVLIVLDRNAVRLPPRQALVAQLYASGQTDVQIAAQLGITFLTVKTLVRKARMRYRAAGREASSKLELRARLLEDGYLTE